MNLIIRNALPTDIDFIVNANNSVNDASGLTRADNKLKERLDQDFFPTNKTRSNARILIAEVDGMPVGVLVYSTCYFMKEGDCIWMSNIFVAENHRRSGIAEKLIERLKEIAKTEKYNLVCFLEDEQNQPAREFAFKNGSKEVPNLRLFFIKL
ncbi:MAG: GNAT family N-acetyltransferase [Alphaproteobacteria bacterium]|nr:GNAT family N-acetyltransferase [Alphaproteobacteria bacterium]